MSRQSRLAGRSSLADWLSLGFILLALGAFIGFHLYADYQDIDEGERARLASATRTVERNLTPQVFGINRAIESIIEDLPMWRSPRDRTDGNKRLQDMADALPGCRAILVMDAQGVVAFSSFVEDLGRNFSATSFFQSVVKAPNMNALYVAPPFTLGTDSYLIGFSRMIPGPMGHFAGSVLAVIDPQYFEVLLDSVRYAPDSRTSIVHGDGVLFMLVPPQEGLTGKDLAKPGTLFFRHRVSGEPVSVFSETTFVTGTKRMLALRSMQPASLHMDKPLVITSSRDHDAVFSEWRRSAGVEVGAFGGLALVAAASLYLTQRRRREQIVERDAANARIKTLLDEQQLIFDHAHVGILFVRQRAIVRCNKYAAEMFGYATPDELEHRSTEVLYLSQEQYEAVGGEVYPQLLERGFSQTEVELKKQTGEHLWVLLSGQPLNPKASGEGSIWVCEDITERKRAETEMRIAATAFQSQEAMMVTNAQGVILRVNEAFTRVFGYVAAEAVGQTPRILRSGRHDEAFYDSMWATLNRTGQWQGEIWDRHKDGSVHPGWLTISAVKNEQEQVTHYVSAHVDITQRKAAEDQIHKLAFYDPLTGLPNRRLLLDRLKQAMALSARADLFGAVLFIDIDHFKTLNDTLGHFKGDILLQQAAQRLIACVREGDTVARLGGDEFLVMLENLSGDEKESAARCETVGEKILAALNQGYQLDGSDYRSSASIGVALFKGHQTSADDLFKQADLAMYKAKAAGRDALRFFDPIMESAVVQRVMLESELRYAIGGEQLELHFQVQVRGDGNPTGAEALVRWNHPSRGRVSPVHFIPLAEETGLIVPLGRWVLAAACKQLAEWAQRPATAHWTLAINVSAREFYQKDYVQQVLSAIDSSGANPHLLKLELTESLLAENIEDIVHKMSLLKERGVGFSLDDFGTGYSSLTYLKRLPLNQLKIDQSFVRDVLVDTNDAAIARTVVALADSLGLDVIAEGVETNEQRDFLARQGCQAFQGYLFGRPMSVIEFDQAFGSPTTSR